MGPWLAVAALGGALAAALAPLSSGASFAAALALASLAVPLPPRMWRQGLVLCAVGALAAAHAARARDNVLAPPLGLWFARHGASPADDGDARAPAPIRVRGVLEADATPTSSGAVRLELQVLEVDAGAGWKHAPGRVLVHVQGDAALSALAEWTAGRGIVAPVALRWPAITRNPGGSDPTRQRLTRGHVLSDTIKSASLIEVTPAAWWDEAAAAVRRHVRRAAARQWAGDASTSAAIVTAILIGDRAGLTPDVTRRLIDAGTYHVVAISGGNVAIVTLIVIVTLRGLLRSSRVVSLAALVAVVTYGWVVGHDPSVARAVTAAAVWLGADAAGIRAPPLRVFGVVVLILIAIDPLMVIAPGAWLSFGATAGILLGAARLSSWLLPPSPRPRRLLTRIAGVLTALWAATLAAELVLLPVGAWTFARVSIAGTLLNFVAIPAMAIVQLAGLVAVSLLDVWPASARIAAMVAHGAARALVDSARLVEYWPVLAWRVPPPHVIVVAGYYGAVAVILAKWGNAYTRRVAWGVAGVSLVIIATGPGVARAAPPPGTLRITMLDVGQGDATVVQFPGGQVLVIDAGAVSDAFDAGERIVMPALWALGARRVDWVAFTHADLDHIGGVAAVVHEFRPREIWEGVPVPRDDLRAILYARAGANRRIWRALRQGDTWEIGGATLEVIHPPAPDWERQRVRNDDSLVFRLRYGELDLLLTGDISQVVEADLPLGEGAGAGVRVLKVAHHGSRGSSSSRFVERYKPWVAVVSAGRNNAFGHPAPDVLQRLDAAGATTFRTDRHGAVSIESDGKSVRLRTWAGQRLRLAVRTP